MYNTLRVLYNPKQVFVILDNFYEEDLNTTSHLIAAVFGCLVGTYSIYAEFENLQEIVNGWLLVIICGLGIIISSAFCLFIYNYLITYLLYWIGKLLGSNGLIADTRTAVVHSIIPLVLIFILAFVLKQIPESLIDTKTQYWVLRISIQLIWIWTMVILVVGLNKLNKYGIVKALINVLPLPFVGLIILLLRYF